MEHKPNESTETFSNLFQIVCLILLMMFNCLTAWTIIVDKTELEKKEIKSKVGALYLNLKFKYRISRFYNVVFIIRRILLAVYATTLQRYSGI